MQPNSDQDAPPPYRVSEVAQRLGLSEKAVRDALNARRLYGFRVGKAWLIPRAEVNRLMVGDAA
jgi:excisionase family DNA binding protein